MPPGPRYAVGIDLGTTNSVMAVVDLEEHRGPWPRVEVVPVAQVLDEDAAGELPRLPSFLYRPPAAQERTLPAFPFRPDGWLVGEGAVRLGRRVPGRQVASAKSWLCHGRVDRRSAVLPWGGAEDVPRLSPVQATRLVLEHLRWSWDASVRGRAHPLAAQRLTVTLPASFDQRSRSLVIEAIEAAGLAGARLLEEPQAAFYHWIALRRGRWEDALGGAERVLVCDVGGGTTDFSLVACRRDGGALAFDRLAVGRHLLLGGDNMDLGLARHAEAAIAGGGKKLAQAQWQLLAGLAREAKERLFLPDPPAEITLRLPGAGTKVVGGARQARLGREEALALVLDGFFPLIRHDAYQPRQAAGGLADLGLPYEAEPAVTWHVLDFLASHDSLGRSGPQAVLFNGGALHPQACRRRILEAIAAHQGGRMPLELQTESLDAAVALGAAFYGYVSLRGGVRIGGGTPTAYYLRVGTPAGPKALCVAPKGTEPHEELSVALPDLAVRTNACVSFPLLASDRHPLDATGAVRDPEGAEPAGSLAATVRFGKGPGRVVPVRLAGEVTELGTLALDLVSLHTPHRWKLEFDLRSGPEEATAAPADDGAPDAEKARAVFAGALASPHPVSLLKAWEDAGLTRRADCGLPVLRVMADALLDLADPARRTPAAEAVWLSALGFSLRPGTGHPADPGRLDRCWSLLRQGPASGKDARALSEWAVLWRRVAYGLEPGRQNDLFQRNKAALLDRRGRPRLKAEGAELLRLSAACEHLPVRDKAWLVEGILAGLAEGPAASGADLLLWSLARLATRQPLYGALDTVLPPAAAAPAVEALIRLGPGLPAAWDALVELARRSGERELELPDALLARVVRALEAQSVLAPEKWRPPLERPCPRAAPEQARLFGDALPAGLSIG